MKVYTNKIPSKGKCEKPQEINIDYIKEIEKVLPAEAPTPSDESFIIINE